MKEPRDLTPQEILFCDAYARPESETFGSGSKSIVVAGWPDKNASQRSNTLRQKKQVDVYLKEIYAENAESIGEVVCNIQFDRRMARDKGDWSTAARCDELLGKRHGMFREGAIGIDAEAEQLSDKKATEARKIAQQLTVNSLDEEAEQEPTMTEADRLRISGKMQHQTSEINS